MLAKKRNIFLLLLFILFTFNCKTISRMTAKGGSEFIVQVETNEPNKDEIFQQAINKLQHQVDAFGLNGEVGKIPDKPDQLNVKIYEPQDIERIKKLLFTNYQLEVKKVVTPPSPSPLQRYSTEETARQQAKENQEVIPFKEKGADAKTFVIVEKEPVITGKDIRYADVQSNVGGRDVYSSINFSLKKEAGERFGSWTSANINNYLAVVLNKEAVSIAYLKSQITDSGVIDGNFTKAEAEDIALSLNSGHLPATFKVLSETVFNK